MEHYHHTVIKLRLEPDPLEAQWVNEILKVTLDGKSVMEIKRKPDTNGVESRRKKGSCSTGSILRLIKNTYYIGYYTFEDKKSCEVIKYNCPPIMDDRLYHTVHSVLEKRVERRQHTNRNIMNFYLVMDFMHCDHSGAKMHGHIKEKKNERLYYCPQKEKS